MLAKMTSRNQITLPDSVVAGVAAADVFEAEVIDGRIVLTPVRCGEAGAVRDRLAEAGLAEEDIGKAVDWARRG